MPRPGERAYAYAKACDIIGKTFVGKRIPALGAVNWLNELDRLIFPKSFRDLPEKELLVDLERRIMDRAADQIIRIVNCFARPPEFLARLVRGYEYADLKSALTAFAGNERELPGFTDLGRFQQVNFRAWPDLAAMLRETEFEFLLEEFPEETLKRRAASSAVAAGSASAAAGGPAGNRANEDVIIRLQTVLDIHYYTALWESMLKIPVRDRVEAGKILEEEIALRNVVWTLRLRSYYGMEAREIREHLVHIDMRKRGRHYIPPWLLMQYGPLRDSALTGTGRATVSEVRRRQAPKLIQWQSRKYRNLCEDAEAAMELPLDHYEPWLSWRRAGFLNPDVPGRHWKLDPRHVQNAASEYLYNMARVAFHRRPFALDATVCYVKLKLFEEDLLTSVAEGLALGMQSRDVLELLEVKP